MNIKEDIKIGYLAAMIDADGNIGISKLTERRHAIRMNVKNTSEALVDYLKVSYGGYKQGPYKAKQEKWKDAFRWICHGKEAIKIIKQIEPYLIVKQLQAKLAINAYEDTFKIDYGGIGLPKFAVDKRERYYQDMKKLNTRGKQQQKEQEQNDEEIEVTLKINKSTQQKWLEEDE